MGVVCSREGRTGEEAPGYSIRPCGAHRPLSHFSAQMEQAFARRMLKETPEEQAAALSLLQSLQDPLPSLSIPPVFFETASASLLSTCLPQ